MKNKNFDENTMVVRNIKNIESRLETMKDVE